MTSGVITLHRQGDFGKGKTLGKRPLILPAKVARAFTESARQAVPVAREKIILAALAGISPAKPSSIHVEQISDLHVSVRKKGSGFLGTPEAKTDAGKQGLPELQRTNQGKGHNYDKKPL